MKRTIVIVAEHFRGKVRPVTYESVSCARKLQAIEAADLKAVILGNDVKALAVEPAETTGLDVIGLSSPHLSEYNGEVYKDALEDLLQDLRPAYVCVPATTQGADLAPGLAIRLSAACVTGVESVNEKEGRACFTRALFGGKIVGEVLTESATTILTIQPGSFKKPEFEPTEPGRVEIRTTTQVPRRSRSMGIKPGPVEDAGLKDADVVVSAGRGIGKKENVNLIKRLASIFSNSAVGGSRPVCDSGWLEYNRQVGQTGATVAPRLYVACGISGAVQHLVGMQEAEFIAAVNRDPDAAIFRIADVSIVEDLVTFIPVLIEEWEKMEGRVRTI